MTDLEIEVFLAICKHKNFSKAAQMMFMSQSSISERLRNLENKLGVTLFQRNRGNREITLTPQGIVFRDLALQHSEITKRMLTVGEASQTIRLRIGCLSSIGNFWFPQVCQRFLQRYPQSELSFSTMNGTAARAKLANREIDLAFSTYGAQSGQINATPFFLEPLVFICSSNSEYPDVVEPGMLSHKDEIYRRWSYDYERWHQSIFGAETPPLVATDFLDRFWPCFENRPNTWSIVPSSVAASLCNSPKIRKCQSAFHVPDRMIFSHTLYETAKDENILLFLRCFQEVLREQDAGQLL